MISLIGEYECKVDAKGRFMFPVGLRKQLADAFDKGFVMNRNLHQKCLVLYPLEEWNKLNKSLSKLNRLLPKHDALVRRILGGATGVEADSAGRLLVPKPLSEYAGLSADIKVLGSNNIIEIWDKKAYEDFMAGNINMEELAEEVFTNLNFGDSDE
jgi:MraZ protein